MWMLASSKPQKREYLDDDLFLSKVLNSILCLDYEELYYRNSVFRSFEDLRRMFDQ